MRYGCGRFEGREVGVKSPTPRGTLPFWSRNCRELFFQKLDNPIMVTDHTATAPAEDKGDVHLTFLLNFFDELRRRAEQIGFHGFGMLAIPSPTR